MNWQKKFVISQENNMKKTKLTWELANQLISEHTKEISSNDCHVNPVVSVCMMTYNHHKFIKEAIDSVIAQKTDFPIEFIIGDDCSTDGTTEIVLEYQKQYPEIIRVLLAKERLGKYTGNGRLNSIRVKQSRRGKYIALLEGDDYWTDALKLQKQVDFFKAHPDCTICFHNVKVEYDDKNCSSHPYYVEKPLKGFTQRIPKSISTLDDLVKGNFIQTPSTMFRSGLFDEFPDWFYTTSIGDWPLHILNAQHGQIGYLNEIMAVYRVHKEGVYSSKNRIEVLMGAVDAANKVNRHLHYKYANIIKQANENRLFIIISLLEKEDFFKYPKIINWILRYSFKNNYNLFVIIKRIIKITFKRIKQK